MSAFSATWPWTYESDPIRGGEEETNDTAAPDFYTYNESHANLATSNGSPSASCSSTMTIIASFKWLQDWDPNYDPETDPPPVYQPPPATISVRLFSAAHVRAWHGFSSDTQQGIATRTVENGLGDTTVLSENDTHATSSGSHIIQVNSSSGLIEIPISPHFEASVANGPVGKSIDIDGWVSFGAERDKRTVFISSPTIQPSYHRTMDGSHPLSKYRNGTLPVPFVAPHVYESGAGLLNEPNPNGSYVGDSVASWDGPSNQWMAQGTYQANTPYFVAPLRRWSWIGGDPIGGANDELASGNESINLDPYSGAFYDLNGIMLGGISGHIGVTQSTLVLKATDSDGATGENTFTINWHMPYKKLRDLSDSDHAKNLYWVSSEPLTDGGGLSVNEIPAKTFDLEAAIDDVSVIAEYAQLPAKEAEELLAVFKAVTNILNWGSETEPEIQVTSSTITNDPYAFRSTVRERPENILDMTVEKRNQWVTAMDATPSDTLEEFMSSYDCYGGRVRYHHRKNVLADHYDIHGFESPNHTLSCDVTEKYAWETFYVPAGTTPTPPSLGEQTIPDSYSFS